MPKVKLHDSRMLANKVALITGAAQGIGLAATRLLLKNGGRVSMVDISEKIGRVSCSELQKEFSANDVIFLPTDVTKRDQLVSAFQKTKEAFGGIDIVCNNAGLGDESRWRKMLDVNLMAVIEGTFLAVEYMSESNGGRGGTVVNVASFGGIVPMQYSPTYCASKHGVVGFSRSMKDYLSTDGVHVNCICPEFVDTDMVREGMPFLSEDVKSFILGKKLLSPDKVAMGILELILDTSKVGAVMTVTEKRGIDYFVRLPGEKVERSKAKL